MKADRIITLDFCADGIRIAVAANSASGVPQLTDCRFGAYDAASNLPKEAVTAMTLRKLLDEIGPKTTRAHLSIEGQAVFSRVVKLPMVGKDQVEKTIRHEAVQNIPFPIDEVLWDAHVLNPDSAEPEVLLAAVKADLVEGLVHAVKANGLEVERITVAPAALANVVYAACSTSEPLLLVEASEASTNLVFVDGPRIFFRSLPIAASETARREQEVKRSISFYVGQQGGREPRQLLDAAELDGIESGFAVCAGLACSQVVSLNLQPSALLKQREMERRLPYWLGSAVAIAAILAVWIANFNIRIRTGQARTAAAIRQVEKLEAWEERLIPLETRISDLNQQAALYGELLDQRTLWLERLSEISTLLPDGMFLLNSEPIRPMGKVTGTRITVLSYLDKEPRGRDVVKLLRDALRTSPYFTDQTKVFSRPSKKEFAREFVLDVDFAEVGK